MDIVYIKALAGIRKSNMFEHIPHEVMINGGEGSFEVKDDSGTSSLINNCGLESGQIKVNDLLSDLAASEETPLHVADEIFRQGTNLLLRMLSRILL